MYNVYIRPLEKKDALISYKWRNDPEVWKYTGSKPNREITWEIEDKWIDQVINDTTTKRFAILVDEVYVGNIQLTEITDDSAVYHIFIGDKNYWGKGISKQATFLILNYARYNLNLSNVSLEVKKDNIVAFKSYLKSGFKLMGERDDWYQMNYNCHDVLPITVSVFVMVYNHENYLNECLDGIILQKTNFNVEIVVGEDYSTDKSREILLDYYLKYPGKFKLILHEENVGANKNQEIVFQNCTGKYIAICEGDDYWTDPLKLQKQVDFLEDNEDYVLCFHKVSILRPNGELVEDFITKVPENYQYRETLAKNPNYIHTPSVLFRNVVKGQLNIPEFINSPIGDYFLYLILTQYGKIGYLKETMTVYRYGVGVYSGSSEIHQLNKNLLLYINLYSYEKDVLIKEIFFDRIQSISNKLTRDLAYSTKLLETRRHQVIEKIYQIIKK